jgi:hypothetical protein
MKVLIACEFSGIVRNAFTALGHDAWSCDLEPTEQPGNHYQCDVREILNDGWDLMIAHPPCTYICNAGLNWLGKQPGRKQKLLDALDFVRLLMDAPIPMIAIENPLGKISTLIKIPDQVIRPYMFGQNNKKDICLWLKNLPCLLPTNWIKPPYISFSDTLTNNDQRQKIKSRSFTGIAAAMAKQWGTPVHGQAVPAYTGRQIQDTPGYLFPDHTGRPAIPGTITLDTPGAEYIPGKKPGSLRATTPGNTAFVHL